MARYTVNVYAPTLAEAAEIMGVDPTLGVETEEVEASCSQEANVIARAMVRKRTGYKHLTSQVISADYSARARTADIVDGYDRDDLGESPDY